MTTENDLRNEIEFCLRGFYEEGAPLAAVDELLALIHEREKKLLYRISDFIETPHEINKHILSDGEVWDKALGVGANFFYRKVSDFLYELKKEMGCE